MTKTIVCFGDSNTHGTPPMRLLSDDARFGPDIRWPQRMARQLGPEWHLVEEGHPGRNTVFDDPIEGEHRNGFRVLPAIIESHKWIDVLVIMLGTNDCKQRFGLTTLDIALGMGRLVDLVKASPYVHDVLVVCPPPVLERGALAEIFQGAEKRCEGLADKMRRVAQFRQAHFFNAGDVIACDPLDGVHFSEEAHADLGTAIAAKVSEIGEKGG
ncbi:MAG: SGNH/GDSL hydrolase family protein [Ahrensia sp.]|nr:SGNH/GDSL hydrolase family protein [Ahrensia sp.]